jgi:anti-sigma B factor antagonist
LNINIIHSKNNDTDELKVVGEIDAYTAPELKEALLALTEIQGNTVVLNLSQTTYMDSTGIGVIIAAYKSSKINHATLVIKGLTPRVQRLFDITGLSDIVRIDSVKEEI